VSDTRLEAGPAAGGPPSYSPEELAVLSRHVSNVDRNVYVIYNLPPEVVAVIFAYVSRSPRSFRENLLSLIRDREIDLGELAAGFSGPDYGAAAAERASRFHEKWVVHYGHASVAELSSGIAVGVEKVSRLASACLELANPFLSFIEYSQRYQMPRPGDYYLPPALLEPGREGVRAAFRAAMEATYQFYQRLHRSLVPFLLRNVDRRPEETDQAFLGRVEKLSFEDARYALTLAVHTNLGMVGNARALRDAIVTLLSAGVPELAALGQAIRAEVSTVVPTLLRYADPDPYRIHTRERLAVAAALLGLAGKGAAAGEPGAPGPPAGRHAGPEVRLLEWTGRGQAPGAALNLLARALLYGNSAGPAGDVDGAVAALSPAQRERLVAEALERLGPHDHPVEAFTFVRYQAEFTVSEANWHQLLRHSRKVRFLPQAPSIDNGITVPPRIAAAGLVEVLDEAVATAEAAYRRVAAEVPGAEAYLVTNAHRRRVLADFDLWEAFHLVNLRGKPEAQWDIRQTVLALADRVREVHPFLDLKAPRYRPAATAPAQAP